jgi:hypothetical protein
MYWYRLQIIWDYGELQSEKWVAGSWGRGEVGNPEKGERPRLKAATKQRLMKTERALCVL